MWGEMLGIQGCVGCKDDVLGMDLISGFLEGLFKRVLFNFLKFW